MNTTVVDAVKNKEYLSFTYDGYERIVEPHAYGVSKTGKEVIRAYQTAGGHASDHSEKWHLFSLSKIKGLTNTGAHFVNARPGYRKSDKAMPIIYAQI